MLGLSIAAVARCAVMAAMTLLSADGRIIDSSTGPSPPRASATDGGPADGVGQWRREAAIPWDAGWHRARARPNFLAGGSDAAEATGAANTIGGREEEKTTSAKGVDAKTMAVEVRHERREVAAKSNLVVHIPSHGEDILSV